jgi:hypothetical protein
VTGAGLRELLEQFEGDPFAPIRLLALESFAESFPGIAEEKLRAALLSPRSSIRDYGRFYLRKRGIDDFAAFYRGEVAKHDSGTLVMAILGLGEVGEKNDAQLLIPYLSHNQTAVRKSAVRSIGRLDAEGLFERFLWAIRDSQPGVAKTARNILRANPYLLRVSALLPIFEDCRSDQTRLLVLSLFMQLPWWDRTPVFIRASADSNTAVATAASGYLVRSFRGGIQMQATPQQLEALRQAIGQHSSHLDKRSLSHLHYILSYVERNKP